MVTDIAGIRTSFTVSVLELDKVWVRAIRARHLLRWDQYIKDPITMVHQMKISELLVSLERATIKAINNLRLRS